jgi:hypothetical protein
MPYLKIVRDCKYQVSLDSGTLFLQMLRNFLGLTDGRCSMNDDSFDEKRCVEGMRKRRFVMGIANYHIYKAAICFFYGAYSEALQLSAIPPDGASRRLAGIREAV